MLIKKIFFQVIKKESTIEVFYLFAIQLFNVVLPIFVTPYLMIKLGLNAYGIYGFSLAFAQYFILLIDFGFNLSATQRIAMHINNKEERDKIFKATLISKLIILGFLSIIYFLAIYFVGKLEVYYKGLLFIYPILLFNVFTFQWFYQGIGKIKRFSLMTCITKILILPLTFIFVQSKEDIYLALIILISTYFLNMILNLIFILRFNLINFKVNVNSQEIKLEIKESFPIFLSTASSSIYTQLFVVMLGFFAPLNIVGIYTSSEKIIRSIFGIIYLPITQVFFHRISSLKVSNNKGAVSAFYSISKLMIGVFVFISFLIFFLADYVDLVLGKDYYNIIFQLKTMSVLPLLLGVGAIYGQLGLLALGDFESKRIFRNVYIIGGIFSLIFSFLLIPRYLEKGALISLICTEFIIAFLMVASFYNFKIAKK